MNIQSMKRPSLTKLAKVAACLSATAVVLNVFGGSSRTRDRALQLQVHEGILDAVQRDSISVAGGYGDIPVRIPPPSSAGGAQAKTTFLLGIFSTKDDIEVRERIRNTMLAGGHDRLQDVADATCSLADYIEFRPPACQVIYTFVVGFLDHGPPWHKDEYGVPMTVDPDAIPDAERDVTYLNIKENMEDGKTPTYFKYASRLADEHGLDYIAKTDSDTLISIKKLIDFIDEDLPPTPKGKPDRRKIYGGMMVDMAVCGGKVSRVCQNLAGKVYMAGQFYFVSIDLAKHASSDKLKRHDMVHIEDLDFGMWVLSYPEPVKLVVMTGSLLWIHNGDTKREDGWNANLKTERTLPRKPYFWPSPSEQYESWRRSR